MHIERTIKISIPENISSTKLTAIMNDVMRVVNTHSIPVSTIKRISSEDPKKKLIEIYQNQKMIGNKK